MIRATPIECKTTRSTHSGCFRLAARFFRSFSAAFSIALLTPLAAIAQDNAVQDEAPQEDAAQEKSAEAPTADPVVPVFEDGEAQVVDGFKSSRNWIRHDLWVETEFDSDGDGAIDRMHVSVTRQQQTETEGLKVPVVYITSPYFAGTGSNGKQFFWDPEQELGDEQEIHETPPPIEQWEEDKLRPSISNQGCKFWVPRGFAVVHSCSPGTGLSQGCPTVGGSNESLAPKAVIDWLNGRAPGFTTPDGDERVEATPWCTGKVGMTGTSYNGTLPIAAATTGVDGLEVVIPDAPNTSYYHYYRSNGLVRHPGGYMGEDVDVLYDFIDSGSEERREWCDCEIRDKHIVGNIDRESGDYSEWWEGRDYGKHLDNYKAATLMSHGFNDWNVMPEHTIRIYEALKEKDVPLGIYLHQGGHGGPPPRSQMNRWFSRYLYGIENGIEDEPKASIVREGERRSKPTMYAEYPNPDAEPVTLFPGAGGLTSGELSWVQPENQGTETLIDDVSTGADKLAAKQESENRLLFVTPELVEPVHISGTARINIKLACDQDAANLSVWMVSLPWEKQSPINANIITRGWADPQNHSSLTDGQPLEPGEFYELMFDLQPDDQIIPAGQKIGLMIFSSDRDFTMWPDPGTKLTVDLDATSLELPVVGGRAALEKALIRIDP